MTISFYIQFETQLKLPAVAQEIGLIHSITQIEIYFAFQLENLVSNRVQGENNSNSCQSSVNISNQVICSVCL